ncbi:structure-specific endonuclease subunit EME1-like isoform X2 [Clavelina lepadiformis]
MWTISSESSDEDLPPPPIFCQKDQSIKSASNKVGSHHITSQNVTKQDEIPDNRKRKDKVVTQSKKVARSKDLDVFMRKAAQAKLKSLKPEQCLKNMVCLIDFRVAAVLGANVLEKKLTTLSESTYKITALSEACVRWQRKVSLYDTNQITNNMNYVNDCLDENFMMVVLQVSDFAMLVCKNDADIANGLSQWANNLKENNSGIKVGIICLGLKKYNQLIRNKAQRDYKQTILALSGEEEPPAGQKRKRKRETAATVTTDEIEDALVQTQLTSLVNVHFVENQDEFVTLIQQCTKAIAETPYKCMKRKNMMFINEKSSVKVDSHTGEGSRKVWRQMLMELHNVSPEMASAIVNGFPSLNQLLSAYQQLTPSEGENLLSEVIVRRGVGSLENRRKIGPELSRRIYRMYTSTDGNALLH